MICFFIFNLLHTVFLYFVNGCVGYSFPAETKNIYKGNHAARHSCSILVILQGMM
jgi:hypothetical protein